MTRVAIISPGATTGVGGVERFSQMLSDGLEESGKDVRIFVPSVAPRWWHKFGLAPLHKSHSVRRSVLKWSPDLIITNGTHGFLGRTGRPRVHVFHGTMPAHSFVDRGSKKTRDWLIRGVLAGGLCEWISGVGAIRVAVSESAAREVRRFYGMRTAAVINNGVRGNAVPSGDRKGIIFVGRREHRKGYETAVALAAESGEQLMVAGPGHDPRTINLGVLTEAELSKLYSRAKVMLFPSEYEACSYVILEALAHRCPVVTTRVGWVPELLKSVPRYAALTAEPRDVVGLRRSMARVLSDDGAARAEVASAYEYVHENNSRETFISQWLCFLSPILEEKAAHGGP